MKKWIELMIAMTLTLALCACGSKSTKAGMTIENDGSEITVAWDEIEREPFEGELVNGEGESSQDQYEGAELRNILEAKGIEVAEDSVIAVTAEDDYFTELTGAEVLEKGKVYVALSKNGEIIEDLKGEQGAKLIVFGDLDSSRAVKYLKTISIV